MDNLNTTVERLIQEQLKNWPLAKSNYRGLESVKSRKVLLPEGSEVLVQFNPERIRSSAAKVDVKSIEARACFLCEANRPQEQKAITYGDYSLLINPFPIFKQHLTIPIESHQDQLILPHFSILLDLAKELSDFTLFYNGPKCGASAPDHFHFQAGNKGFLPIEEDFKFGNYTELKSEERLKIYTWKKYHRGIVSLQSKSRSELISSFKKLYALLAERQDGEVEPMLNMLCYYENNEWLLHVFPRILHRPSCYFEEGEKQILLSPASVDLGGVFITPREKDFNQLNASDIESILRQVCLSEKDVDEVVNALIHQK